MTVSAHKSDTPDNSEDVVEMAIETARRFVGEAVRPRAAEIDETDAFPKDLVREMHELGLVGVTVPEDRGGLGASAVLMARILEEIATVCPVLANINMVQSCYADFLAAFAPEDIAADWVPGIISGEKIVSVAMTEPDTGSDISAIRTTATLSNRGFVLTGEKQFITLAHECDAAIVFAADPAATDRKARLAAFFVEADREGFSKGRKDRLMGMHGEATGSLILDHVEVPASHRFGAPGEGFAIAESSFNFGRIAIAALALGIARGALVLAAEYARTRQAFGRSIGKFQGVSFPLADDFAQLEAARAIVHRAAGKRDRNAPYFVDASIGKLLASDLAVKAAGDAVQTLGGAGFTREHPAERLYRDAKVTQIYEGTNQIQRMILGGALVRGDLGPEYGLSQ